MLFLNIHPKIIRTRIPCTSQSKVNSSYTFPNYKHACRFICMFFLDDPRLNAVRQRFLLFYSIKYDKDRIDNLIIVV